MRCTKASSSSSTRGLAAARRAPAGLLRSGRWRSDVGAGVSWRLVEGDVFETLADVMPRPDLVFYNAGVDVLKGDRFGRLALSPEGVRRRDERVFRFVKALGAPLVVVMGGGYNRDPRLTVEAHAATYRLALSSLA